MTDPLNSSERATYYPNENNLGKNCEFWGIGGMPGCDFPKAELMGRKSCEGMIDDVCLFIKDGRKPQSLTEQEQRELKTRPPDLDQKSYLPPGGIV